MVLDLRLVFSAVLGVVILLFYFKRHMESFEATGAPARSSFLHFIVFVLRFRENNPGKMQKIQNQKRRRRRVGRT